METIGICVKIQRVKVVEKVYMPENAVVNLGNLSFTERAPVIGWHIMEWVGGVVQHYIYLGQYQPL